MTPQEAKDLNDQLIRQQSTDNSISPDNVSDVIDAAIDAQETVTTETDVNEFFVTSALSAPPGSPSTGEGFRVLPGATGLWSGHDNDLAYEDAGDWDYTTPTEGDYVFQTVDSKTFIFQTSTWHQSKGVPILNGGNKISNGVVIGTNNNKSLSFKTNKIVRATIDTNGILLLKSNDADLQSMIISGQIVVVKLSTNEQVALGYNGVGLTKVGVGGTTISAAAGVSVSLNDVVGDATPGNTRIRADGVFLPSFNTEQRDNLLVVGHGQLIYNTDNQAIEYVDNGNAWHTISGGGTTNLQTVTDGAGNNETTNSLNVIDNRINVGKTGYGDVVVIGINDATGGGGTFGGSIIIKDSGNANVWTIYGLNSSASNSMVLPDATGFFAVAKYPNGNVIQISFDYVDDTAAAAGGVAVGELYHNNGAVRVRLT